jgi:hypothetical protein
MKIAITGFVGANKAIDPKLLPPNVGTASLNQKPGRGSLQPWRVPLTVATVPAGRQTIYRYGRDTKSDANYWFSLTGVGHFVRGYNLDDTTERTYFTGSGTPKWVDNTFAVAGAPFPTATRELGVPAPATQAIVTGNADGVSENTESRYYTYTYVNAKGDESAPAPVSLELVCKTDDTAAIGSLAAAPGGYNIDRIRIYVTVSGQSGETEFFFLREIGSGLASTTDDLRERGEVLPSTGWDMPPANLSHLTAMWNGMLAGISGNGVRVCVAYKPYAWPIAFEQLPPDAKPVALGRVGEQSLLVLTTGRPALLTGTSPDSLDLSPLEVRQACVAPRAVVSFGHGVAWPCEDGLAYYGAGGAKLLTQGLFTRDDWQALNPTTMIAGIYEGAYLCFYSDAGGNRHGFMMDPLNPQGVYFLETGYDALYFDELQDALYVYESATGNVKKWDAGVTNMSGYHRSGTFVTPPVNFGWARVYGDGPTTLAVYAGPFTAPQLAALTAANPAITADGTNAKFLKNVPDELPFRLPGCFLGRHWQIELSTLNTVQAPVELATGIDASGELA